MLKTWQGKVVGLESTWEKNAVNGPYCHHNCYSYLGGICGILTLWGLHSVHRTVGHHAYGFSFIPPSPKIMSPWISLATVFQLHCRWIVFPHEDVLEEVKGRPMTVGLPFNTQRQHFLSCAEESCFHITFGQIPRVNPWFSLVPDITCSISLLVMEKGKLIAGQNNNIQLENIWLWRHGHFLKGLLKEGEKKTLKSFSAYFHRPPYFFSFNFLKSWFMMKISVNKVLKSK